MVVMITKAEWELRQEQWAALHRWEESQTALPFAPEDAIASVGTLYEWLPPEARHREEDPERKGVQRMYTLLEHLSRR
jgi:hypothetical protein